MMTGLLDRLRRTRPGRWLARAFGRRPARMMRIDVQPGVHIKVSWKDQPSGRGPYASFRAGGEEVLRFDCFGPARGHYHVYPRRCRDDPAHPWRLELQDGPVEDQIERAVEEIVASAQRLLETGGSPLARSIRLDPVRLDDACRQTRRWMRQYHHAYGNLVRERGGR